MAGISRQVIRNRCISLISRNFYSVLRQLQGNNITQRCKYSNSSVESEEADPAPFFFNEEIQQMLKVLTRRDLNKVFRVKKDGQPIADPEYQFMTDKELQAVMKDAEERADKKLQMPPVVKEREPITTIISKDPEIQGYDTCKYVFTDITYNVSNVNRIIVVRDSNGILRQANWDERFRMNQIYFPLEGREYYVPKMFFGEHLQDLLKREEYEFILDRACVQFDPDDPDYQRVTKTVYDHINEASHFKKLISTRHYGPMVFHLVWRKNIENLLLHNIKNDIIEDAALLIKLYHKIHPSAKSAQVQCNDNHIQLIEKYVELDSTNEGKLRAAINAYKEFDKARKEVEAGIRAAHGLK
ncbi:28S ribosomal protein S22, mitochondrial [Chelonus insularis]|uniref:28S ribosomal protein S22, mitochondrial n=1 Tax=Chelonus insularis TaxID=460826 RepID=UPI00158CF05C|nr:28S ribosomal protein S22, mitochondrial [Chelonus insularis]